MKNTLIVTCFLFFQLIWAQPDSLFLKVKLEKYIGPQWVQLNKVNVDLNQVAFVNWNAGGSNSISGLFGFETQANYSDKYYTWKNDSHLRLGMIKPEKDGFRKTEDLFDINSNLGYQSVEGSKWFYSVRFNFKTQLLNGYAYPNTDNPISAFMAPGYMFLGAGMEYGKNIEKTSIYISPLTFKATFVLDDNLANAGSFGVKPAVYDANNNIIVPGEHLRKEFGVLVTNSYETTPFQNVTLKNQLSLYSDYINKFGNVDVDWQLTFNLKVNNFISATLGSHLRYDDDVKTTVPAAEPGKFDIAGARVQLKQMLGVGFVMDF